MISPAASLRVTAGLVTLLGIAAAALAPADRRIPIEARAIPPTGELEDSTGPQSLALVADLFRAGRVAPVVRYDPAIRPARAVPPPPPEPPPERPDWQVTGIVGGFSPVALVMGIDGSPGQRVVSEGDTLGSFVVADILADSVLIRHAEQVWAFSLARPWDAQP